MDICDIMRRENEPDLLKIQYASRKLFNKAEHWNYISWLFCIFSAFTIFISNNVSLEIRLLIPLFIDIFALICNTIVNKSVEDAAKLRNYFDSYVLSLDINQFSNSDIRKIKECAYNIYERNKENAEINLKSTGKDNPPGVYDWYTFNKDSSNCTLSKEEIQFECQKQNVWWNSKMTHLRIPLIGLLALFIIIASIILCKYKPFFILILCSSPIIMNSIDRLISNFKYLKISNEIEASKDTIEKCVSQEQIAHLQKLINKRRSIPVLELDFFHRKKSNEYSNLYDKISYKN